MSRLPNRCKQTAATPSRSFAAQKTTPFLPKTARKATASDDDVTAAEEAATPESPSASVPEDLDYYDGLLGQQPAADRAVSGGEEEAASTSDYPIPLPSYLLLALATVLSIAFTGSIFEVTGGHPEVSYWIDHGGRGVLSAIALELHALAPLRNARAVPYDTRLRTSMY